MLTTFLVRLILYFIPSDGALYGDDYHHIYFGLLMLLIFTLYNYELHHKLFYIFAIAVGLIVDEIVYLLPVFIANVSKDAYFSWYSFLFLLIGLTIVYLLKDLIVEEVEFTQRAKKIKL